MTPENIRPIHDRVLVRALGKAFTTANLRARSNSGLILIRKDSNLVDGVEGDYRRMPLLGEIIAVGPGKYDDKGRFRPTTVKPGETVVFTDWQDWEDAPAGLYMIREGDVWGYPQVQTLASGGRVINVWPKRKARAKKKAS